ncbi:AraC family transcriptional regulator [Terrimonas sp. NA20]|uniref:AraC family transcriptional regulator n=1 Tax=Terrimonas ginsenosidimutans TaxID=2908004 RepID=A0ABS9KK43_9BACT|nr:AraC family transcriptional regulator [Terrimonas ginsenosidimutans]MCG2612689.1 AraC family transcriptional regulator [Terrimonas ginsenosidimutans]
MKVTIHIPHPALQAYVLSILTVDATLPLGITEAVTPYPPSPFQSLIFYCRDAVSMGRADSDSFEKQPLIVFNGPQISRVNVKVHEQLRSIRVDLLPGALYRILGIPMHELADGGFDARDFFDLEMKAVQEQLQNISGLEEGKSIVEAFLLKRIDRFQQALPFDAAIQSLLQSTGLLSVEQTASLSCLSLKQFERKCKERIGMNPKLYARILKFSKAYRLREALPHLTWTNIAHEAGYFDQMHMIRDFKNFAGVNPSVIEQQLRATPLRMQKDMRL